MSTFCRQCTTEMADQTAICPNCGYAAELAWRAGGTVGVFPENIAGAIAYVTVIPPIIFLLIDPYRKNRFVRFHSLQCLLFWLAIFVTAAVLRLAQPVIFLIPNFGYLLFLLMTMLSALAAFVLWALLIVKALQGEALKVPLVGDLAERQAAVPQI